MSYKGRSKPPFSLLPGNALEEMAKVFGFGALKYERRGYLATHIDDVELVDALGRHYAALLNGRWSDEESGLPHLAHIMANCAMLLHRRSPAHVDELLPLLKEESQ